MEMILIVLEKIGNVNFKVKILDNENVKFVACKNRVKKIQF